MGTGIRYLLMALVASGLGYLAWPVIRHGLVKIGLIKDAMEKALNEDESEDKSEDESEDDNP